MKTLTKMKLAGHYFTVLEIQAGLSTKRVMRKIEKLAKVLSSLDKE